MSSDIQIPAPFNEPVLSYAPGTPERDLLKARLAEMSAETIDIPLIIGGEEVRTGDVRQCVMPHNHQHVIAAWHAAGPKEVRSAIRAAKRASKTWATFSWLERSSIFLRAAELLANSWRSTLNASTMLGQSKTAHQAEIDAACELIDFFRFNAAFAEQIYEDQPLSGPGVWNRMEYRPLEGFVFAISPFNFTSIAANLCAAPAIMGNTVVWKPSVTAVHSGYYIMKLLEEAGLPPGVINFIPGEPAPIADQVMGDASMAGLHFTGSTNVFRDIWQKVGNNIHQYSTYPRLVGETGGKDFVVAHPSADSESLRTALIRGAFEFQGQKCSAASRAYIPRSIWRRMKDDFLDEVNDIRMGDPADFRNFMGAVISQQSFDKITGYIQRADKDRGVKIAAGGDFDDSEGFFVRPTVLEVRNPEYATMCEEIFGPVLSVHVYKDDEYSKMLKVVDQTSPYALTGAIFARDRTAVVEASRLLRHSAGNFYINDKPTGAVVGQQPFGGSRASGTNDKAGSMLNLVRWTSPRTIKETFDPPTDYTYPFMDKQ